MTNRRTKRALSLALTLALLLGLLSTAALAAEEGAPCPNHPAHDADCGYVEAVEAAPCKHGLGEHDENCGYAEGAAEIPCDLGCTDEDGDGAIDHAEGCAYTPAAAGSPCGHAEHDGTCGYAAEAEGHLCEHACALCAPEDSGSGASGRDPEEEDGVPAPLSDPGPGDAAETVGAFTVSGGEKGTDYSYANSTLTVLTGTALTIQNTNPSQAAQDKIVVASGAAANITLAGVNIDVSGTDGACAFDMTGATVALTLADGSDNVLKSGYGRAGLHAPEGSALTIGGSGKLEATGIGGAGIGGGFGGSVGGSGGSITISGGTVEATGGYGGAGIGGGYGGGGGGGDGGKIRIYGNATVTAAGPNSTGIGGGYGGSGGNGGEIQIYENATVTATGGGGAGVGGCNGATAGAGGTITIQGNAVVFSTGAGGADHIGGGWGDTGKGDSTVNGNSVTKTDSVVFEDKTGTVYGSATLPGDLTIPVGFTLTILDGKTLTNGHILTNDGEIKGSGTLTGDGVFTGTGAYTLKATRAIDAPRPQTVEQTRVTLNAVTLHGGGTVEYARSDTTAAPADGWQTGLTFDGLTAGTTYYFFARVNANGVYKAAVSTGAAIQTAGGGSSGSSGGGGGSSSPSATEKTVDTVEKAKDGDTVKVNLPSGGKLPGEVLEAAAGKDITLEIDAGNGVTWIINGKDIPKGKLSDLDLKVNAKAETIPVDVINALTGEKKTMQLTLSHDGPFGFPLTLRLEVGKENAGRFANLYYYDETAKALEYQSTAEIGADGAADIPFMHASSYAVVIDETSHAPVPWENPFADVSESDWFYEAAAYVHQKGLMVGSTDTAFDPDGPVTRAQVWTVLARLDGADVSGGAPWYARAQGWAVETGVSDGTDPDGSVTREQLVTMLYRFAQDAGMDVSVGEDTNILSYDDAFAVAEWAIPAFQWACGSGVVSGTGETMLSPQAGATRAQLAAVLMRFLENMRLDGAA